MNMQTPIQLDPSPLLPRSIGDVRSRLWQPLTLVQEVHSSLPQRSYCGCLPGARTRIADLIVFQQ